jgi:phenylpyruvate tautomerase PptA (4-oxalocrotonate tautomerase family)
MAQVKVYALRRALDPIKRQLSDVIHACVMEAFAYPADKRAHRFFPLETEDFFYPPGRSERYTIIEISMFEGRSVAAKKQFMRLLFERAERELGLAPMDLELTISESPKHNWAFRGLPGDEHVLGYKVEV